MELFSFRIKLIDPVFFAREAISGAFTPPYIHATALNHAVAWAMGKDRNDQSYLMTDQQGGRNTPRYENSLIDDDFYFTPARLAGSPNYYTEIVKGDGDKAIQIGYGKTEFEGKRIKRRFHNEILKAYRIYSLAPESVLEGYIHARNAIHERIPKLIRLGSFRGIASLEIGGQHRIISQEKRKYCDHPIDPLVSRVIRGISVPMLPYPIADQAIAENVLEIKKYGQRVFIASVFDEDNKQVLPEKHSSSAIV